MNLSRFSVLAVFFMMIMSAFVTVPTYNVGADEHEGGDDRPPGEGGGCMDYEDTNDNGLYDEGEPCYDRDEDNQDEDPEAFHATLTMDSLEDWTVDYTGVMPVEWSDNVRTDISEMCEYMFGTASGEITEDCFNSWLEMMNSEDDGQSHDDGFRCPPGMDDETCSTMMECSENDSMNMDCMMAMYIYCYENTDSEMCEDFNNSDDEDDGGQFIWGIIAYEAGHIDATELMEEYMVPEFGDMGLGTFPDGEDGRPVLYDVQTFNADSDGELIIHPEFMVEIITTPDFVCGDEQTVDFSLVNNDIVDCQDGSDEQQYDDEGDEINWFDCHDGSEISMTLVNDDMWDCHDGEDEYQEHHNYWYGEVYLFEGDHSAGLTDFDNIENVAFRTSHQEWKDENKTDINYEDFIKADISAGTWSLVTTGSCHTEWGEDDEGNYGLLGYDCHGENGNYTNSGPYSHKLEFGSEYWLVNGSINHESMEMANFPYMDNYDDDRTEFVMYQYESFSIDTDSSVSISSAGWYCYDYDDDGVDDYCYGENPGLYLYHGEDLLASNRDYYNDGEDMFCPIDSEDQDWYCNYALLEEDLVAGDYTIYTTFHSEASYYNNIDGAYVVFEGEESDDWDGHMKDNHWEWQEGDDDDDNGFYQTVAYDGSVYDLDYQVFWSEAYDFEWNDTEENPKAVEEEFGSVYELYENYGDVLGTQGSDCDGCMGNLEEMDADTSFDITNQNEFENWTYNYEFEQYYFQFMDENENGVYDSGEIYAVSSEGSGGSEDQYVLVEGSADRKYMPKADQAEYEPECYDDEGNEMDCDDTFGMFAYMFMIAENATHYEAGNLTAEEAANNSVELFYMLVEMGLFDQGDDGQAGGPNGEEVDWNNFSYCEWEGADWADDTMWYCDEDGDEMDFEDYWYYCEHETEPNHMWYCTDDFGQSSDYHNSMDNTHHADGTMPERNHGVNEYNGDDMVCYDMGVHELRMDLDEMSCVGESMMWVHCSQGPEGTCEALEAHNDNPPTLDGILGINNPKDNEPMPMSENMIGVLSDNEGLPLMVGTSFKINFDGVDESLNSHELYIPIDDQENGAIWYVEMNLLDGYEIISCEDCEDLIIEGSNAKFNADQPVTVTFGPRPDCDQTVTIGEGGYSFEPAEITIAVGDTVCWIWDNTVDSHNVVEIISEFDADLNLTEASVGFESSITATTMDFRHTFTEDDMTHYYVCEPHATMGMVGKVTVGSGSADDKVPEALEESGLPNVSFIVGALVLVGAAGLRRRIH